MRTPLTRIEAWGRPVGLVVALLGLASLRAPAVAQDAPVLSLDVSGGPAYPVGASARATSDGAVIALGLNHRLGEQFSLVTEFQHVGLLRRRELDPAQTDIILSRISLGLEARLLPIDSDWKLASRLTAGLTRAGTDPVFSVPEPGVLKAEKINADVFALAGAVQIGRDLGGLTPFVRVQAEVHFTGSNLKALGELDSRIPESGPLAAIPVHVGLRIGL